MDIPPVNADVEEPAPDFVDEPLLGLVFDDTNEEKLWAHSLTISQVDQILDNAYAIVRNRQNRRAPKLLIGRDHGGQCIAVPIEPTYYSGYWRPVTGWPFKPREDSTLRRMTE